MFRRWLVAGSLLVVLIAAASVTSLPWKCQAPEPPNQTTHTGAIDKDNCKSLQTLSFLVGKSVAGAFAFVVDVIVRNDKAIVALSTVFIAIFTGVLGISTVSLWRSTDRLWKASQLDHPSKFSFLRAIVFVGGDEDDVGELPRFVPGEIIKGRVFAVNKGPYSVKLKTNDTSGYDSDCYFHWHRIPHIPMWTAYKRWTVEKHLWVSLKQAKGQRPLPMMKPHGIARWDIETTVPKDFKRTARKGWSHTLFMSGRLSFIQNGVHRGDNFSKRYVPKEQRFIDCGD